MNEFAIFFVEILAFSFFACAQAEVEGKYGGGGKHAKFFQLGPVKIRRYHLFTNFIAIPLFILLAMLAAGFSWRLLGVLVSGGFIGGLLLDFVWFVVNPHYGVRKFNSKDAYWLKWWKFGRFELPYFYVTNPIVAIAVWLLFVY